MNERNQDLSRRRDSRARRAPRGAASVLTVAPLLTLVVVFGLVFLIIMGVRSLGSAEETDPFSPPDPGLTEQGGLPVLSGEPHVDPLPSDSTVTTDSVPVTSTEAVTTEPTTTVPPTTEPPGPVMMTVDDSYFSDALFIGDSRTNGLCLYSTPGACKHYYATSMTIFKVMDSDQEAYGYNGIRSLLQGMKFGKIYIMFGINECGYNTGAFADKFKSVVEEIRSYQPDAIIYIQSICYVTQKHEANYPVFATANIKEKNETLKQLANDVDIFYLEVNDCLNDGTDHLPSDYTGDGVHLKASYYRLWHDYLLEHAVVDAKHPWTPQSEDSTEPEGADVENP